MQELILMCCILLDMNTTNVFTFDAYCPDTIWTGAWSGHYKYYTGSPDIPEYKYYDPETGTLKDNPYIPSKPFSYKPLYHAYITTDYCFMIQESLKLQLRVYST